MRRATRARKRRVLVSRLKNRSLFRYVLIPLALALLVAAFFAAFSLFWQVTGISGRRQPSARPVPLAKAWADQSLFVCAFFVISFVVFAIRSLFRRW